MSIFDDPEVQAWLKHVEEEMFPKMKSSALSIMIWGEPDPKLCIELGAAIALDKPLVVVVRKGQWVSPKLLKIADEIVEIDPGLALIDNKLCEEDYKNLSAALKRVTAKQQRPT